MCKCGCRGWCTLYPVLYMLHLSFLSMATETFGEERPDGQECAPVLDAWRRHKVGQCMNCIGALRHIKRDWMEYSTTFGLPTWSSILSPCVLCECEAHELYQLAGTNVQGDFPYSLKDLETYSRDAARCERWVSIDDPATHQEFCRCLKTDKRKQVSNVNPAWACVCITRQPP